LFKIKFIDFSPDSFLYLFKNIAFIDSIGIRLSEFNIELIMGNAMSTLFLKS